MCFIREGAFFEKKAPSRVLPQKTLPKKNVARRECTAGGF